MSPMSLPSPDLRPVRRMLAYIIPYWRQLVLVVILSVVSTVLSLFIPYLSKDLIDRALLGRDLSLLVRIVSIFLGLMAFSFILNTTSGLRYTRVSADILFDMRLALYRHLQ